jgi:hypothetical protein
MLDIETLADWAWAFVYILIFYISKYFVLGYFLENSNAAPKTEYRKKMQAKQISMGFWALFWVVLTVTLFMWKGE